MIHTFSVPIGVTAPECDAVLRALAPTLEGVTAEGVTAEDTATEMEATFTEDLTPEGLSSCEAALAAYAPGDLWVRIFDYMAGNTSDRLQPPKDFDFGLAPLHKQKTEIWQGDILEAIYYGAVDPNTGEHTIPVVRSSYAITYHAYSVEVHQTLAWYRRNGSIHPDTKAITLHYFGQRWLSWLESKRSQIIDWLRWNVANAMLATLIPQGWTSAQVFIEGAAFFGEYGARIYSYVSGYDLTFPNDVQTDSRTWLDETWPGRPGVTIRDVFHEQLIYTEA